MNTRALITEAMGGALDVVRDVADESQGLSDDVLVARYVREHKGQALQLLRFAEEQSPPGSDPMTEAIRYEAECERLLVAMRGV